MTGKCDSMTTIDAQSGRSFFNHRDAYHNTKSAARGIVPGGWAAFSAGKVAAACGRAGVCRFGVPGAVAQDVGGERAFCRTLAIRERAASSVLAALLIYKYHVPMDPSSPDHQARLRSFTPTRLKPSMPSRTAPGTGTGLTDSTMTTKS